MNKVKIFVSSFIISILSLGLLMAEPPDDGGFPVDQDPPIPVNGNIGLLVLVGFALFSFVVYKQKVAKNNIS